MANIWTQSLDVATISQHSTGTAWTFPEHGRPAISPALHAPNTTRLLVRLFVASGPTTGTSSEIQLDLTTDQTGNLFGSNLTTTWANEGFVVFLFPGGQKVVFPGPNHPDARRMDTSEEYGWQVEPVIVEAFNTLLPSDARGMTLLLRDGPPEPIGTTFSGVTGTLEIGDLTKLSPRSWPVSAVMGSIGGTTTIGAITKMLTQSEDAAVLFDPGTGQSQVVIGSIVKSRPTTIPVPVEAVFGGVQGRVLLGDIRVSRPPVPSPLVGWALSVGDGIRMWHGEGTLVLDEEEYTGGGDIVSVAPSSEMLSDAASWSLVVRVSNLNIRRYVMQDLGPAPVRLEWIRSTDLGLTWEGFGYSVNGFLSSPRLIADTYTINIESKERDADRRNPRRWNDEYQQFRSPGDSGFRRLGELSRGIEVEWPPTHPLVALVVDS